MDPGIIRNFIDQDKCVQKKSVKKNVLEIYNDTQTTSTESRKHISETILRSVYMKHECVILLIVTLVFLQIPKNYNIVDVLMLHIYIIVSPSPRKAIIDVNQDINRVELRES